MTDLKMRPEPGHPDIQLRTAEADDHGSDVVAGDWTRQVVTRLGNPPLRFNGRRLSYHWRSLLPGHRIEVALWERRQKGVALGFSRLDGKDMRADAANFKTLAEAADLLEGLCRDPQPLLPPQDNLTNVLSSIHLRLRFRQQFAILVGDVLADWDMLLRTSKQAPFMQEPSQ
jgi:hypothetical protein